jgi:tetratricopeptide (TPR) repeat protein
MLSEEALILFAATGACALLVLGILELVAPTRSRHPRRSGAAPPRDPWRRARSGPPAVRREDAPSWPARGGGPAGTVEVEPPIERLLLSEAASVAPPAAPPAPPGPAAPAAESAAAALPASPFSRARPAPAPPAPVAEPETTWIELGPAEEPGPVAEPSAEHAAVVLPPAASSSAMRGPAHVEPPSRAEPEPASPVAQPAAGPEVVSLPSAVARCYALYEAGQLREVLGEAVPALESGASGALFLDPGDTARLWGVVGLARQELGDHEGARAAFADAIANAPEHDRATWQRHLGALALHVGQQLLAQAKAATADGEERVTALHGAIAWLDGGLAAVPEDSALRESAMEARAALWPTYEQVAGELLQRQDFDVARRVVRQALADPDCPAQSQAALRELLSGTYSGEVGQLTAEAIRRMQEGKEDEALATLDRAEAVLTTIPVDGLAGKRRQELERRLWWSYTKVGMRRVEGGMHEEALAPLLHALHFASVGPERLDETKRPLVRALDGMVEARSPLILRLASDGDRDGALVLCDKLWSFLRDAMDRGLAKEDLSTALTRTQAIFEKLGKVRK